MHKNFLAARQIQIAALTRKGHSRTIGEFSSCVGRNLFHVTIIHHDNHPKYAAETYESSGARSGLFGLRPDGHHLGGSVYVQVCIIVVHFTSERPSAPQN